MGEYVVAYEGEHANNEFHGDGHNQHHGHYNDTGSLLIDQYHDVDQIFWDAIYLSERIHDEAVCDTIPTEGCPFHPSDPEEANIRRLEQLYA
jgi:hypothetical protein